MKNKSIAIALTGMMITIPCLANTVNVTVHNLNIPLQPKDDGQVLLRSGKVFGKGEKTINIPQEGAHNHASWSYGEDFIFIKATAQGNKPFNIACLSVCIFQVPLQVSDCLKTTIWELDRLILN